MQAQGGGMANNMQKLQDQMQRQLQAQQLAQFQQQQGLQRHTNQQASMMGSTGSMGNLAQGAGGLGGMNQQAFANQQWSMDPTQSAMSGSINQPSSRSSLAGLGSNNAMAMMQSQTVAGMGMGGMAAGNQSWLYAKSGGNSSGLGGMDLSSMTMPGSSSKIGGMLDQSQQMQALLQRNMGLGAQSPQMSQMNQGQLSSNDLGGLAGMGAAGAPGLGGAGNMLTQAQQMQQLQLSKMGGSSSSLLGMSGSSGQGQMQQNNNLMATQMEALKRQLGQGNDGRRSSSVSALSGMSQAQLLQLQQQQQQQRGSATSSMLGMAGASLLDRQSQGSSLLGNNSNTNALMGQQRKPSLSNSTEPISLSSMMSGNDGSGISSSSSSNNRRSNDSSSLLNVFDSNTPVSAPSPSNSMLMAQALQQQQMKKGMNSMGLDASALLQQQQQQQQLLGNGNMGQLSGSTNDMQKQLLTGQLSRSASSNGGQPSGNDMMANNVFGDSPAAAFGDLGGGNHSDKKDESGKSRRGSSSRSSMKKPGSNSNSGSSEGQSFLGGTFAGGWQSNKDIPDRRNVIYSICKVIEEMRPDASKMSQKLPFMAKRLEEHLYRSAQTKEEYLNKATLKKRLQMIAHGLEVHRDKDSKTGSDTGASKTGDASKADQARQQEVLQQLQQLQQMKQQQKQGSTGALGGIDALGGSSWQQQKASDELLREHAKRLSRQGAGLSTLINDGSLAGAQQLQGNILQQAQQSSSRQSTSRMSAAAQEGILKAGGNSKYPQQDPQKRRVIKQQQQRLLLLRHASKCKSGASCKVKFCDQMVQLWKHMKKCRDKHCKTPHCLSSRCVLNHYRICKSENKTASCEVCGPVTKQIKQQNAGGDSSSSGSKDSANPSAIQSGMNPKAPGMMDQLTQEKRQQLEKLQFGQQQLAQQEMLMKQLQQQQQQLIEQQKSIQQQQQHVLPHSPEEQQLQQRQALLQQLQQQFTNQKMLLQQQLLQQQSSQGLGSSSQLGVASQLSLDAPDPALSAKRSSSSRRSSKSKTSLRMDTIGSNQAVARAGKGKRLSTLENQIHEPTKSGSKRSAGDLGLGQGGQPPKSAKADQSGQSRQDGSNRQTSKKNSDAAPDEAPKSANKDDKVLEQGDADHTTSLIGSMDSTSIEKHLDSLPGGLHLTSRTITHRCLPVVSSLLEDQYGWVFRDAVDPDVLGLPDYFDVVKNPMHLSLIEKKLENGVYKDLESFERDTKLVFENAILYNGEESEVGEMAKTMLRLFDREYKKVLDGIKGGQIKLMKNGDICALCASQRRLFEPTVLNCSGSCGTTKIRRNSYYHTDPSKSNFWCMSCFTALKDDEAVILDDGSSITKYQLQKLKNDATPEEAWVQCDTCNSWVHQICALFNGRKNKSAASYSCPKCHLKKAAAGELKKSDVMKGASQLPHCKMSQAIEQGLHDALEKTYRERALAQRIPYAEVEKAEGLSVRVISNMEKKHLVRDEMFERYSKRGCPQEFPVRSKCVALFQTIHGVDVILFGMYVFEYNHECPAPNRRRVYISYIDSVNYFRPKDYRTLTYQTIIVEYLRYVKERGFHTAHIWSCPPSPGDDYIFHIHPTQQRIPKDDMLCQWYHDVLEKAKSDGVVLEVRTLYDEYFKNNGEEAITGNASDPTCLPYFEGDYIPGELENIIKDVKADEEAKRRTNPNWEEERPSSSSNRTGKKTGTRSNPGSLVNVGQDKVMLRLGLAVSNMKQNFFVARLRSREFASAVERGDDVSEWKEDNDGSLSNKRPKIGGKASSGSFPLARLENMGKIENAPTTPAGLDSGGPVDISAAGGKPGSSGAVTDGAGGAEKAGDDDCSLGTVSVSLGQSNMEVADAFGDSKSSFDGDKSDKSPSDSSKHGQVGEDDGLDTSDHASIKEDWDDPLMKGKSDDVIDSCGPSDDHRAKDDKPHVEELTEPSPVQAEETKSSKRGFDEMGPAIARHFAAMNAMKKPVGDTEDSDPPQELELFESRQQFLSYCQKNHFQFDELRRAKHTTMMVLYQLHNPSAPKFLQQCGACLREITQGVRYHCNTCSNFDLCEDCYGPVMKGEWSQRGKRLAHDPTHSFFRVKVDANEKGDKKNTEERARAIKAHLELLSHAASCEGPPSCTLNNCQRMKKLFEHVKACNISPKKSCKVCSRLLALLTMHSRLCTVRGRCPLPFCDRIRERNRRRTRQQQLMDDRRRQAQNQLYRQSEQNA